MRAKIVIVDDDHDILLSLENRVAWMGHEPLTATNGKDALRLIQEEGPDLVLLDLELPLLSGLDVLKQVGEISARTAPRDDNAAQTSGAYTTPLIVMLTAYGTIERAVQAMQLGAFDFVPKPFTSDHLTVVINKALATVDLRRQVNRRNQQANERATGACQEGGGLDRDGLAAWRNRHRQGSSGTRDSPLESSLSQALHGRELRGDSRDLDRERALRA
jgi:DNA-binding NtrC family response regulator